MSAKTKYKVVIIGCGNVAWHLAKQLHALKNYSLSIYNHKANEALQRFAAELKCTTTVGLNAIAPDADFYFICVADKFIPLVSKKINPENKEAILLHTSGSVALTDIKNTYPNKAVFYPLQTFSKNDLVDWKDVPLILEASNAYTKKNIKTLALGFGKKQLFLNYSERLRLHLSAVLVNNFSNALFVAASDLLNKTAGQADFRLLLPLIKKTAQKVETILPRNAQTGPAKRNDQVVLKKHLRLLKGEKQTKKLYKQMSKLIAYQQDTHA
jgi:predicted short-subunit dehydrogenase-like oxidoreductase (DUF2520 family)